MSDETKHPLYIDVEALTAGIAALGDWLDKHGPATAFGFQSAQDFADRLVNLMNASGYSVEDINIGKTGYSVEDFAP